MNQLEPSSGKAFQSGSDIGLCLQRLVDELTECNEFALACIWLIDGGNCPSRDSGDHGAGKRADSHLIASAGRSRYAKQPQSWDRLGGVSRDLPLDVQIIDGIGATGEPLVIPKVGSDSTSLMHRVWVDEEHIRGFFGHPLQTNGEVRGVFAVCSRVPLNETLIGLLKTIASTAAELVTQADCHSQLQLENQLLSLATSSASVPLVTKGSSPTARKLEAQIQLAARYEGPVLITGGSGADSREVARRIHEAGPQRQGLLIPVDGKRFCDQMLAAESALLRRFSGTLFLENIELIPFEQQRLLAQFLVSLEEKSSPVKGTTKILASITAKNPVTSTDELQHDLGCLLSVLTVEIPPLNERPNDLQELSIRFLSELQLRHGRSGLTLDADEMERMQQYPWPGNDRELGLALERAVLRLPSSETVIRNVLGTAPFGLPSEPQGGIASEEQVKEWQRENLIACLEQCHWKVYGKDGAAAQAGIKPTTFISRMKKFGIVRRQNRGK